MKNLAILCLSLLGCSTGSDAPASTDITTCFSEWEGPLDPSSAPFEIELCLRDDECTVGQLPLLPIGEAVVVETGTYHWMAAWTRDATLETGSQGKWVRIEVDFDPKEAESLSDEDRASLAISDQGGNVMVDVSTTYGPGVTSWDGAFCRGVSRHLDGSALFSTDAEPCAGGYVPDPTQSSQDVRRCQPCAWTGAQCVAGVDGICRDAGTGEFCCHAGAELRSEPETTCGSAP